MDDMNVNVEESTIKQLAKSDSRHRPLFKFSFERGTKKITVHACVFYDGHLLFNAMLNEVDNIAIWRPKLSTSIRDFNKQTALYLEPGEKNSLIPKLTAAEFQFVYNFVLKHVLENASHEKIEIADEIKNPTSAWRK